MDYALIFTVMSLCQCIITLRVWHLFPRSRFIRWLAVTIFIVCLVGAVIFGAVKYNAVRNVIGVNDQSNLAQGLPFAFVIYLPALIVHTAMLLLTLYRFHVSPRSLQEHGMIHRFVKEGMLMYAFAAGMLLYEIISLSLTTPEDISVYNVALCGGITVATTVVSICRAMLSIRSLAATYHVDPAWLLNHAELSRVQWRRGVTEGEIYIETNEMDVVLPSKSPASPPGNTGREVQNHT
ncbi:hypothetical protein EDB19DRAFT_566708 [Suillus lakei]|nr:hypothetical protein EDB19DRAFT_566708 [Suillus lakei]